MTQQSDFDKFLGPDRRKLPRPRGLAMVVAVIAVMVLVGLVVLFPRHLPELDLSQFGFTGDVVTATVVEAGDAPCSYDATLDCHDASFQISEQTADQARVTQEFPREAGQPVFKKGEAVVLSGSDDGTGQTTYRYFDRDRRGVLIVVSALFALAVIGLARWRGLASLVGLAVSVLVLIGFIVPAIITGRDAVLVALVGGSAIVLVALYLAHGYTPLTHVAAVGAFGALALTTILSWIVLLFAQFTGLASEESFYLLLIPNFDISGLLLAGVVLGAIGALDDVTVTQASAVWELRSANPNLEHRDLFESGLRVGRDHIASTVNTLLLAYAGAAMPLLILFSLSGQQLSVIASSEVVAVEIVRTLVGSIGLVAAVPITTWLAARQAAAHVDSETQPA